MLALTSNKAIDDRLMSKKAIARQQAPTGSVRFALLATAALGVVRRSDRRVSSFAPGRPKAPMAAAAASIDLELSLRLLSCGFTGFCVVSARTLLCIVCVDRCYHCQKGAMFVMVCASIN
jgi:hypothetical protein